MTLRWIFDGKIGCVLHLCHRLPTVKEIVIGDDGDVCDLVVYRGLSIDLDCVSDVSDAPCGVCAGETD